MVITVVTPILTLLRSIHEPPSTSNPKPRTLNPEPNPEPQNPKPHLQVSVNLPLRLVARALSSTTSSWTREGSFRAFEGLGVGCRV